jgi:hypothetical protein
VPRFARSAVVAGLTAVLLGILAGAAAARPDGLGRSFVARIDPGLPTAAALGFARAAVAAGLSRGEALRILNDDRFRAAVGSPDQGYGLLGVLSDDPRAIRRALGLVERRDLKAAGADSLQNAIMSIGLQIRNAYLKDLGKIAVVRPDGVLVLVDLETGRQILGKGMLGVPLTAPGGGPLPSPSPVGIAPSPAPGSMTLSPPRGGVPALPPPTDGIPLLAGAVLIGGLLAIAWAGYAVVALGRGVRSRRG